MNKKYDTTNSNGTPRDNAPRQPPAGDRIPENRPETPIQNTSSATSQGRVDPHQEPKPKPKATFVSSPRIFVTLDDVEAAREYEELRKEERISLFWWLLVVLMFMAFMTGVYYFVTSVGPKRQQVVVTLPENQGVISVQTPRNQWEKPQVVAYYAPRRHISHHTSS